MVEFQPKGQQAKDPGKADISILVQKQKKIRCPSSQAGRQEASPLTQGRVSFFFYPSLQLIT